MYTGFICCYSAFDLDNILICCKGAGEFLWLCIQEKFCLAANEAQFPIGMIKEDGFIVKCGLPCCTCGLKKPTVLVAGSSQCLCIKGAASFPFSSEYVAKPVCAVCFLQCMPEVGCMKPPPGGGAPPSEAVQSATMSR